MNEILEKAKRDYPIGTKVSSIYKDVSYIVSKNTHFRHGNAYTFDEKGDTRCIYDNEINQWAEILNQNNMTQQEFNSLRVGEFISQYEILHKYKEFLIVRCDDGHDLFDLNKINKLGLKVTPKTFMGLDIKKYDYVPCEVDGNELCYLVSVTQDSILCSIRKNGCVLCCVPTSIRIL